MTEKRLLAAAFAALSMSIAPAAAADLPLGPGPRVIPAPIEVGGGWYLRGDVGVGIQSYRNIELAPRTPFIDQFRVVQDSNDNPAILGIGAGYAFNDWFRMDGTIEYRTAQTFQFLLNNTQPVGNFNNYTGRLGTVLGMVNAYADIGNFYGITPFVGVGVGFANHRVTGFQDVGFINGAGGFGYASPTSSTQFAWALHAGLAYTVTDNLKLELSYRYLDMGNARMGTIVCQGAFPCNPQISYTMRDLTSHDLRLGMRWTLGAPAPVPVAPRPVIARN